MAVNTAFHTSNLHSIASERSLYKDLLKLLYSLKSQTLLEYIFLTKMSFFKK